MATYCEAFETNTEHLTFDTVFHHRLLLREDVVERLLQKVAIHSMVNTYILASVVYPEVHDTWVALCFTHCISNVTATLSMLNPEITDVIIRIRKCQTTRLWMREARGVEVKISIVFLCPINPRLEVLNCYLISVNNLALEITIDFVKVKTMITWNKALCLQNILTEFVYITSCTWEISS